MGESHIDFRTQSVIMTLAGWGGRGGGLSLMILCNSGKLSNLKAPELSWTDDELCTRILRVPSSLYTQANSLKNHPSAVFNSKLKHKRKKKRKNTHTQVTRQLKLEISSVHSIHRWTPWKNHPSAIFNSKMKYKREKKTQTQSTRQQKLEISSYNIQL